MVAAIILLDWCLAFRASLCVILDPQAVIVQLFFKDIFIPFLEHFTTDWLVRCFLALKAESSVTILALDSTTVSKLTFTCTIAILAWAPFRSP